MYEYLPVAGKVIGGYAGGVQGAKIGNAVGQIVKFGAEKLSKKKSTMTNAVVLRTPNNKRRGSISSSRSTLTMPSTPRKRRLSTQSRATQTQKQTVDNRGTWRVEKPVAQSAVAIRHKQTMKGFKGKKPKKVKVSKKLRKSVLKVLEAKKVYGNAKIVIHGAKNNGNPVNNIKQNVFAYPISREILYIEEHYLIGFF